MTNFGNEQSPVEIYMQGQLHFFAAIYHKPGEQSASNTDLLTSKSVLKTIGSENINGIAYSMNKPISIGFDERDWFDYSDRVPPYFEGYNSCINSAVTSGGIYTIYKNICSDRYFKEGFTIGKSIDITIRVFGAGDFRTSRRCRFIASLIDSSGNKTTIGTSGWTSIPLSTSSIMMSLSTSGIDVVGTDKKLFIELQYEITHAANTDAATTYLYSSYITSSSSGKGGIFISCSVE